VKHEVNTKVLSFLYILSFELSITWFLLETRNKKTEQLVSLEYALGLYHHQTHLQNLSYVLWI
jgi:hypothetical protein